MGCSANGRLLQQLQGHHSTVNDLTWSPDGRWLASCSRGHGSGEVFIWDVQSGICVQTLLGHQGIVYAVTWGSNQHVIVSGGSDGVLRWWNVRDGQMLKALDAHPESIFSLRRSPDGTMLASCGGDGAIMLWDLDDGGYLQTLRRDRPYERVNITGIRGLTEAQKATLRALGAVDDYHSRLNH